MIEIIEEGTKKVVKCNYCGCKFSYEHVDTIIKTLDSPIRSTMEYVPCPQCNENYVISSTK